VYVNIGDRVRRNDLIATLDSRLTKADLAAAQAAAESQRVEQKMAEVAREAAADREQRIAILARKGLIAETELRAATEDSQQARLRVWANESLVAQRGAQVRRLADEKRLLEVRAPLDGLVVARYVDPGGATSLVPVRPIVRISSEQLLVRMAIPADRLEGIAVGARIIAVSDRRRERIEGTITRMAPEVDPASNTLVAEASVERTSGTVVAGLVMQATLVAP
jgi:multidrug efflux pump subunit AcrA (membrane-fusion protein)